MKVQTAMLCSFLMIGAGVALAILGVYCGLTAQPPLWRLVCGALTDAALLLFAFLDLRALRRECLPAENRADRILFLMTAALAGVNTYQCWTSEGDLFRTVCSVITCSCVLCVFYSRLHHTARRDGAGGPDRTS